MNTHGKPSSVRKLAFGAALIGAILGGAVMTPAVAGAEPRSGHAPGGHDSTGWDHIDPMGRHHESDDPRTLADQDDARREYYRNHYRREGSHRLPGTGSNGGWVICPLRASWC
ncbi:hypothetical protein NN3_41730 [Nocardia neocaledoniensis NBRC 108232]|uniref:Uncharacterized protein n=1 Tax=Nocardia neocaledoniensis TaxID=236511 RepID=A0A317NH72_9NOCA|nr:hypothetical protein [Nocardia neocaledoniensis]PWV74525.1 hypothetical protein DFR69_106336 [Nocardia neocaledoniensis]GEM33166.1 hypothetical protein NN3_41730 [Nocardia neocaledoniensis NBRC 108232]